MPPTPQTLTGKQNRFLRALAHNLAVTVIVGKEGVTEGVISATSEALLSHELIKLRLPEGERDERAEMAKLIAAGTGGALVGTIGRVAIFYKRHPNAPQVKLPHSMA
jgi:RNA-binding protein